MNFLFFSIFVLFSLLILRLGYLQIVKGEDYVRLLERTEEIPVNTSVPRGRIFDRTGQSLSIMNPKMQSPIQRRHQQHQKRCYDIAKKLAILIEQDTKRITIGDKRDFWILTNSEEALEKVSKKEIAAIKNDSDLSNKDAERKINQLRENG